MSSLSPAGSTSLLNSSPDSSPDLWKASWLSHSIGQKISFESFSDCWCLSSRIFSDMVLLILAKDLGLWNMDCKRRRPIPPIACNVFCVHAPNIGSFGQVRYFIGTVASYRSEFRTREVGVVVDFDLIT